MMEQEWVMWTAGTVVALVVLDRVLLFLESRGFINYRRKGLSRTGALYHTFELHSVFDPGMEQTREVRYEEQRERDDSGEPPVDGRSRRAGESGGAPDESVRTDGTRESRV